LSPLDGKVVTTEKLLSASCPAAINPGESMAPDGKISSTKLGAAAHRAP
jgi:hypothetical protein